MVRPKRVPLKNLPMPDPKAVVGERRKRDYQKRGKKNDRVSEISDRQAKLAAAEYIAKAPVAEPSPTKPVAEPLAPAAEKKLKDGVKISAKGYAMKGGKRISLKEAYE